MCVGWYVAVAVASWVGGRAAGLLTVALCAVAANYAFVGRWGWSTSYPALATTGLFMLASAVLALLCGSFRSAVVRAERLEAQAARDHQRAEASEQRLRAMFDSAALGIAEIDPDGRFTLVNERLCRLLGWTPAELLSKDALEVTAPEDRERVRDLNRALSTGQTDLVEYEKRCLRCDGELVWTHVTLSAVRDASGKLLRAIGTVEDISERKRVEAELDAERMRWRGIVEGIADEVWVCDAQGRMSLINLPENTAMGLAEFEGRSLQDVVGELEISYPDGSPRPPEESPLLRSFRTGEVARGEEIMRHRETGKTRARQYSCAPMRDADGKIVGAVAIVRDITEVKRTEEALREAGKRKDEFLAVLSHELRNPLAPIRNSLYVLGRAEPGSERARHAMAVIERQVEHMAHLVADLLDVSRITMGKVELQCERIDLGDVIARTLEDHASVLSARGIDLRAELTPEAVWVYGDAVRLGQALGNLLHNASKFTNEGGSVTVSLEQDSEGALVRVRDTGLGIAPEVLGRVFEPFTQADRTLDRAAGGLGLGLALVKGLVELHGGSGGASSEGIGKGAEFTFRLPTVQTPSVRPRAERAPVPSRPRRVLVIEDNVDTAETLKEVLEMEHHDVEIAFSGPDGIAKARAFGPDIVLCDIGLPGMDGYEVARAFRADGQLHDIALVALTGYALAEDQRRATDAGFDRHIAKPPDLDALERVLAELPGG